MPRENISTPAIYKSQWEIIKLLRKVGGAHVRHVYFRSALSANCGVSEPLQPIGRKVPTPPGSSPVAKAHQNWGKVVSGQSRVQAGTTDLEYVDVR